MNFLNEIADRHPQAVSFAAGRPFEGFFDVADVHRHLDTFHAYLTERLKDEAAVRRVLLQYGRTKGIIHELVAANLAQDEGFHPDPESIVVTAGCQEALFLTLRCLRRTERDAVLVVSPSYVGALGAAELLDMPVLPVETSPDGVDFDDLEAVVARAGVVGLRPRACYVIPDFANPTGVRLSTATRTRLLQVAERHDFLLLEDNPYGIFVGDSVPLPTMKALDTRGRVVYLGSFAKSGLPGARVGFVVADQWVDDGTGQQELLADLIARAKSMVTVNTSPIAQAIIGGKLLENGCSLRRANAREIAIYRRNLHLMLAGLAERFPDGSGPRVHWNAPSGGFFLVVTVPFKAGDDLLELSARTYQVLWTPIHHFFGGGGPRNEIRLSFSHLTPELIEVGLDRFAAFVRDQDGR